MFRTKQDVDEHVTEVFRHIKNEYQRNLKCYQIARLYFKFKDYKSAIKYINRYILINSNSAAAHRLLGECYLGFDLKLEALESFKTSLVLNGSQHDLVLKICTLLMDPDVATVTPRATYWLERAESLFPTNPVVSQLRECLMESNISDKQDTGQMEKLILSEINARPTDVTVRIRLLNFFLDTQRFKLAYQHALEVEEKKTFSRDLKWYDCLCNVLQMYEKFNSGLGFSFLIRKIIFLEKRADLFMQEFQEEVKTLPECSAALFVFDQSLHSVSKIETSQEDTPFFNAFMKHMRAQLSFHLATLILKRAKKEYGIWSKAIRIASPLLLQATQSTMDLEEPWCTVGPEKNNLEVEIKELNRSANLRISQAGHILHSWSQIRGSKFFEKVSQFCGGKWQNQAYQDIFYNKEHQQASKTSHFVNDSFFSSVPMRLLSEAELVAFDEASQSAYPDSLHHLVWLGLFYCNSNGQLSHDFRCVIVPDLQFTAANLSQTGAETLNQLDVDAFLCASVICAKSATPNITSGDRPNKLPINISEELCSTAQSDWWVAVNKTYTNQIIENVNQMRLIIRKGIEAVRVWGQHGLHPKVIVMLAKWFQERAAKSKNSSELNELEDRAHLYWSAAIPALERIEKNHQVHEIPNRLFDYRGKDLTRNELKGYLEGGILFLACRLMKQGKHDQAIETLQSLKSPFATFYQALIYEKLASEELNLRPESITSENRSQHIILLTRARDALHLTLDRLRSPSVDPNHPLNPQLQEHLEQVEKQLALIDPDNNFNRNGESQSDDTDTGAGPLSPEVDENLESGLNVFNTNHSFSLKNHSPLRSLKPGKYNVRYEARPSPERLDAQLRHLVQANSNGLQAIVEQLKEIKSTMQMELKDLGCVTRGLLTEMKRWYDRLETMSKKATNVIKPEDLVEFRDEDYYELSQLPQQYTPYQNSINRQATSTVTYGTPAPSSGTSVPTVFTSPENPLIPPSIDPSLLLYNPLGYCAPETAFTNGQNGIDFRISGIHKGVPFVKNSCTATDVAAAVSTTKLQPSNTTITSSENMSTFISIGAPPVNVTLQPHNMKSPMLVAAQKPPTGQTNSFPISQGQLSKKSSAETTNPLANTTSVTMSPLQSALSSTTKLSKDSELGYNKGHRIANVTSVNEAVKTKSAPLTELTAKACKTCHGRIEGNADKCVVCEYRNKSSNNSNFRQFTLHSSPFANSFNLELNQSQENSKEIVNRNPPPELSLSSPAVSTEAQSETQFNTLTSILSGGHVTSSAALSKNLFSNVKPDPNSFKKDKNKDFEGKNSLVFEYLKTKKSEESSTNKSSNIKDDEEEEVEEFVPAEEFAPVVSLPPLVDVKTGEEDDTVLYDERAKLLRFDTDLKIWKERGVGQMKLLLNSESGKVRLIMRRELVLKVCCNHYLDVNMEFKRMTKSDKALTWHAQDYSEGELKSELLALKFANPESMIRFESAVKKAQSEMKTGQIKTTEVKVSAEEQPKYLKPLSELFKPKPGTWECSACLLRNSEGASKCVSCEAPKHPGTGSSESATASKSLDLGKGITLPSTTKFTFGIPQTTTVTSAVYSSTSTVHSPSFTFGLSQPNAALNSTAVASQPGAAFVFVSPVQTTSSSESFAPSTIKTPEPSSATSNSGFSLTTTAPFSSPKLNITSANEKLDVTQSSTFVRATPQTSSSTAASFSLSAPKFTFTPSITMTEGPVFGDKNFAFSFSMTEKDKSKSQNKKSTALIATDLKPDEKGTFEFSFSGVRASETENCQSSRSEDTDEEPEEDDGDHSVTIPVVPLPEKVALYTGEEDEDILYQNRAKLYRFIDKEWKERGLGDVKILRHKLNKKIRLLMRRETILKVCLNHYVNSNIQFNPKDEKTWTWSAEDFSEGEVRRDTFAIRFKTPEIAGEFKKVLDAVSTDSFTAVETEVPKVRYSNSREEDISIVYEKKVTPELREKANKLLLPDNFYAYLEAPGCPGCPGCDDDDDDDNDDDDDDDNDDGDGDTSDPAQVSSPLAKEGSLFEEKSWGRFNFGKGGNSGERVLFTFPGNQPSSLSTPKSKAASEGEDDD